MIQDSYLDSHEEDHYSSPQKYIYKKVRYDRKLKKKVRVKLDELGVEREEPIPTKVVRNLKWELRAKRSQQAWDRQSDKEMILQELRMNKANAATEGSDIKWTEIEEEEKEGDEQLIENRFF